MSNDPLDQAEAELGYWMARAYEAEKRAWKAEKRLAGWMEHWNATARTGAVDEVAAVLDANARADQAEARVSHLEGAARVLVEEVIAAEGARDEYRRGKVAAEARIKAVEDVLGNPIRLADWDDPLVPAAHIRRALESVPPPRSE